MVAFLLEAIVTLKGHETEGIFRVPGEVEQVSSLRLRIEQDDCTTWE
jgi:hypothetical protein